MSETRQLTPFGPCAWSSIPTQGIDEWLWIGIDPDAPVTLTATLPNQPPAQVTHLWGWGPNALLRARIDPALGDPVGAVGGVLGPTGGVGVQCEEGEAVLWPLDDAAISLDAVQGLYAAGRAKRTIRTVTALVPQVTDRERRYVPLQFVALNPIGATP